MQQVLKKENSKFILVTISYKNDIESNLCFNGYLG